MIKEAPYTVLRLNIRVRVMVGGDVIGVEVVGHNGYDRLAAEAGVGYGGVWCRQRLCGRLAKIIIIISLSLSLQACRPHSFRTSKLTSNSTANLYQGHDNFAVKFAVKFAVRRKSEQQF